MDFSMAVVDKRVGPVRTDGEGLVEQAPARLTNEGESGEGSGRDGVPDFRRRLECRGLAYLPFGRSGITWPIGESC